MLDRLTSPRLDWIQVEVSSHCNALCAYCPRTVHHRAWISRHLPLSDFERLAPAFARTRMVHLQGWGEPLLHPELLTMIRLAKDAGCVVGTTTNGTRLDPHLAGELVASGIDVVAISLAGVDARNDAIRRGAPLDGVVDALRRLDAAKAAAASSTPAIHAAHLLLRSRIADVDEFARFYAPLPVSEIVVSTLDCVPSSALADEVIAPASADEHESLAARLEAAKAALSDHGKTLHYRLVHPQAPRAGCAENAGRSLYVSAAGGVAPCVFTSLPLRPGTPAAGIGITAPRQCSFGNVHAARLGTIWRSADYRAFRAAFAQGRIPAACGDCPKAALA